MSAAIFVLLSLAGGVGAVARFVVDGIVRSRVSGAMPWGTVLINISGSLLLGLVTGMLGAQLLSPELQVVLGAGFLGGYTTFSTASVETARLLQERRVLYALGNLLGSLVVGSAAAALGLVVGAAL
ncbi:fluoride efflux transporter CrcB [Brachybacterium halotolerans subsp. kimchii]|uniref:fluoride efflux transporter CrcB n=1 Tax=Brachybacterium halotolerans TaxID=2795215 RepID=UPI001E5CCBBA|nr:fluoride efflux transporter CrcB [Brachybacterium halotolerans]UEJ83862.1 fluoride efflux transporter CrcB [Brachybacterium halotolerans subsp. kimchii]